MLHITSFCMQHCAVARFVSRQWFVYDCTYFVAEMYNVVCYWKTAVFVLWINKFKCSLKTSVSLVLARLRIVPHLFSGIVERAKRERAQKSPHARKGDTLRGEKKMISTSSPGLFPWTTPTHFLREKPWGRGWKWFLSFFSLPAASRFFSRGVIFTCARVSLALLSLRTNGGLFVI